MGKFVFMGIIIQSCRQMKAQSFGREHDGPNTVATISKRPSKELCLPFVYMKLCPHFMDDKGNYFNGPYMYMKLHLPFMDELLQWALHVHKAVLAFYR